MQKSNVITVEFQKEELAEIQTFLTQHPEYLNRSDLFRFALREALIETLQEP